MKPNYHLFTLIALPAVIMLLVLQAGCCISPPSSSSTEPPVEQPTEPPVEQPTEPPVEAPAFSIRPITDLVKFGSSSPLPRLKKQELFPDGSIVSVDESGEALVEGQHEEDLCKIYIYYNSRMQKSSCPKSERESGNIFCATDGTLVFQNCRNVLGMTPYGEFIMKGSWVQVIHKRTQDVTILLVSEGSVSFYPVKNLEPYTLGEEIILSPYQFVYTAPDAILPSVSTPGLEARAPQSWEQLPLLLEKFDLGKWIDHSVYLAQEAEVPYPVFPDLVISIEGRQENPSEDCNMVYLYPGEFYLPVRVTVTNVGRESVSDFNIEVCSTYNSNVISCHFAVAGITESPYSQFWYHNNQGPLEPGKSIVFDGLIFYPPEYVDVMATIYAVVDECMGEEGDIVSPSACYVSESSENNNSYTQSITLPVGNFCLPPVD